MRNDISAHEVELGIEKAYAEFFSVLPLVVPFRYKHHELIEHIIIGFTPTGFEARQFVPRLGEKLDAGICDYRITIEYL